MSTAEERHWTIYVCSLCGSDEIEESNEDSAKCGSCGEWMNTDPIEVVAEAALSESAKLTRAMQDRAEGLEKQRDNYRELYRALTQQKGEPDA
jgi:predicted ATP-dependent serine protease